MKRLTARPSPRAQHLIAFCAEQNFRNYYILSIIYYLILLPSFRPKRARLFPLPSFRPKRARPYPLPIISTVASVSERSGEIKALAAPSTAWISAVCGL